MIRALFSARRALATAAAAAVAAAAIPMAVTVPASADPKWCKPNSTHPYPVVMLHGTWSNRAVWNNLRPKLTAAGFCTFVVEYGKSDASVMGRGTDVYGTDSVVTSTEQVVMQVRRVLQITGASKVSFVTHSQGGLIARLFATHTADGDKVLDTVVTLASTANGTTGLGASEAAQRLGINIDSRAGELAAGVTGQAAVDQMVGSPLMKVLAEEPNTARGVRYLSLITSDDQVATPPEDAGFFDKNGPAKWVWNLDVRDCLPPNTPVGHNGIVDLPATAELVMWALGTSSGSPEC